MAETEEEVEEVAETEEEAVEVSVEAAEVVASVDSETWVPLHSSLMSHSSPMSAKTMSSPLFPETKFRYLVARSTHKASNWLGWSTMSSET